MTQPTNTLPIPGKVYPLEEFFDKWGDLIVPGTLDVRPHPEDTRRIVAVVGVRKPNRKAASDEPTSTNP